MSPHPAASTRTHSLASPLLLGPPVSSGAAVDAAELLSSALSSVAKVVVAADSTRALPPPHVQHAWFATIPSIAAVCPYRAQASIRAYAAQSYSGPSASCQLKPFAKMSVQVVTVGPSMEAAVVTGATVVVGLSATVGIPVVAGASVGFSVTAPSVVGSSVVAATPFVVGSSVVAATCFVVGGSVVAATCFVVGSSVVAAASSVSVVATVVASTVVAATSSVVALTVVGATVGSGAATVVLPCTIMPHMLQVCWHPSPNNDPIIGVDTKQRPACFTPLQNAASLASTQSPVDDGGVVALKKIALVVTADAAVVVDAAAVVVDAAVVVVDAVDVVVDGSSASHRPQRVKQIERTSFPSPPSALQASAGNEAHASGSGLQAGSVGGTNAVAVVVGIGQPAHSAMQIDRTSAPNAPLSSQLLSVNIVHADGSAVTQGSWVVVVMSSVVVRGMVVMATVVVVVAAAVVVVVVTSTDG